MIAIFGCGPAGLLAAHACAEFGVDFNIYSIKRKSPISGAQYIHMAIPGIHSPQEPDGHVIFSKVGTKGGYAKKVYGNMDAECSWDKFQEGLQPAWSMEKTYDALWDMYAEKIEHISITPSFVQQMTAVEDLVVNTIPMYMLCMRKEHHFAHTTVWIKTGSLGFAGLGPNTIIYNGLAQDDWYRASNLWGHESVEYGSRHPQAIHGHKPLGNNCNCHPDMLRVGRFGKWQKGVLAHEAYFDTYQALLNVVH